MAPTYISGVVLVLMGVQPLLGLQFTNDEWTGFITMICGIVIAVRQIVTGRATWFGGRPR